MGSLTERAFGYLVDTHVLLWWLFDDPKLSRVAFDLIRNPDNAIVVSSASGWEIATKHRLGKLPHATEAVEKLQELLAISRMDILPVSLEHALRAGGLPGPHRDPFDRMLIAQGQLEKLTIITSDPAFENYEVPLIW